MTRSRRGWSSAAGRVLATSYITPCRHQLTLVARPGWAGGVSKRQLLYIPDRRRALAARRSLGHQIDQPTATRTHTIQSSLN